MNNQTPYEWYVRALLEERERELDRQTFGRLGIATAAFTPSQIAQQKGRKAFAALRRRLARQDRVYQGLERGELVRDREKNEFECLNPLIKQELENRSKAGLPFLRSVQRAGVPLDVAHAALKQIASDDPARILAAMRTEMTDRAGKCATRALTEQNYAALDIPEQETQIVAYLMRTAFRRGLRDDLIERAFQPDSLTGALTSGVYRAHPELGRCRMVALPSGGTVQDAVRRAVRRERGQICQAVRKRFSEARIRALLNENASIRARQQAADAADEARRRLQAALVDAIPEHYRDLYPLARRMRRRFILHLGPTNSGKTYEGVRRLEEARHGIYLGPLRLLAAEQFEALNQREVPCSLVTGEEQIRVPGSRVQSSTVEMADLTDRYDVAVIDECQMIADRDRGGAWTAAILGLCADEIHACASPDAEALLTRIIGGCGDTLTIVRHERMAPLEVERDGFQFPGSVRSGDALIVFSKARVHAVAAELRRRNFRVSLIYGALPPDVRRDQAERFREGASDVVVSTDAIAMGMNLPIERVVFLEPEKFDGDIVRPLTDAEIKQIAGRAGRYGQYDVGYVNAFGFKGQVTRALQRPLPVMTEAVVSFPESLLGIPLPLTGILRQWLNMQDRDCFSKASTARMEALAELMETPETDKRLLYRFLCIPFDEGDSELLGLWREMYRAECAGTHADVQSQLPIPPEPEACKTDMLDALEAAYRRCDLLYNYARLFLGAPEDLLNSIQDVKDTLSDGIIHILSTQKLQQKTCPLCKRALPWNWPHRLCDSCYRAHPVRDRRGRR